MATTVSFTVMKRFILSLLVIFSLQAFATEDKGTTFRVLDQNDSYITCAKITVEGAKKMVIYSDLDGQFTIPEEVGEKYTLKVEMVSFQDQVKEIDTTKPHSKSIELTSK